MTTSIAEKSVQFADLLGARRGAERALDDGGRLQRFKNGRIYDSPATGAHHVTREIHRLWKREGGRERLGYPVTDSAQGPRGEGQVCYFEHGRIQTVGRAFDGDRRPRAVQAHFRVLTEFRQPSVEEMLLAMQRVFDSAGIVVRRGSLEMLDLPDLVSVELEDEQAPNHRSRLASHRDGAAAEDIVVFFLSRISPPAKGFAQKDPPAVLVRRRSTRWTLAHEVGHVLDLLHINNRQRLMHGRGTHRITRDPPILMPREINRLRDSPLVQDWKGAQR